MLLKDKVIVISGVGPGMGRDMARLAAAEGAKVALGARKQDYIDKVAAEIRAAGGDAIALSTDVMDGDQCAALARATVEAFGTITGLINTAYIHSSWVTVDQADPNEWAKVFDVNCLGALRMAQAVLPAMQVRGGGSIINVSTMSTVNPFSGEGGYATAKGGMTTMTRHMAKDFARYKVRVNATRMGWIGGESVDTFIDQMVAAGRDRAEVVAEITDRIPLGIIPPGEECAKGVLFFLSDYASMVTGATLDINGGQYMAP